MIVWVCLRCWHVFGAIEDGRTEREASSGYCLECIPAVRAEYRVLRENNL